MGLTRKISGGTSIVNVHNPDPSNFKIIKSEQVGDIFVTMVMYPNCINFEGKKILVTTSSLEQCDSIDPHFIKGGNILARFIPTTKGWVMALQFAKLIS